MELNKFLKDIQELPEQRRREIETGIQNQIIAQAEFVRDELPERFLSYIEGEISKADASMLKMVEGSSQEGAVLCAISDIYIWNKERKQALVKLRDNYIQQHPQDIAPEPQQALQDFATDEAKCVLSKALDKGLISVDRNRYKWGKTASLYGYFVDKTSYYLNIRHSNNRLPWQKYEAIITNHNELLATAKQAVNEYKNKGLNPPEGDDIVNDILK